MLPNRFPDAGETPEYNTVDATLWFFEAARAYLAYTGDEEFVRTELYPVFADIISWHARGTRYGIKVDPSGLLASGAPGVQLTWMDAKVGDWVVTPRQRQAGGDSGALVQRALHHGRTGPQVWRRRRPKALPPNGGDGELEFQPAVLEREGRMPVRRGQRRPPGCVDPAESDFCGQPALHHAVAGSLPAVVEKVRENLLTPYGLRTLAPGDPQYRGRYTGGPVERDGAYHQGTVWPWLIGPFITAYVKVSGATEAARRQAGEWLRPCKTSLRCRIGPHLGNPRWRRAPSPGWMHGASLERG